MSNTDVLVISGGLSYERDVSLRSGRRVADALQAAGNHVTVHDADAGLLSLITEQRPGSAFIALHGPGGDDGSVRSVLELAGVGYVGASADAARSASDKPVAKALLRAAGVNTPDWVALPHDTFRDLGAAAVLELIVASLGLPLMVKPAHGGSGLGATAVFHVEDLPAAMMNCFAYGGTALVERHIRGVDVAVTVIDTGQGPSALTPVEIEPPDGVYDYTARYTAGVTHWHTPPRQPAEVIASLKESALQAHRALGIRDLSRSDALVCDDGTVQMLELNVSPGMTETSLVPLAIKSEGWDLGATLSALAAGAATRSTVLPTG